NGHPGPTDEARISRFGKSPLTLPDDPPHGCGQLTTVEITNRAGIEHWNDRQRALDAAMHALRISVVKMRAHDAKREVLLHALVELGSSKPPAERLLPRDQQRAANERADGRPRDRESRVPNARWEFHAWKGCELTRGQSADKRDVRGGQMRSSSRPISREPQRVQVHSSTS